VAGDSKPCASKSEREHMRRHAEQRAQYRHLTGKEKLRLTDWKQVGKAFVKGLLNPKTLALAVGGAVVLTALAAFPPVGTAIALGAGAIGLAYMGLEVARMTGKFITAETMTEFQDAMNDVGEFAGGATQAAICGWAASRATKGFIRGARRALARSRAAKARPIEQNVEFRRALAEQRARQIIADRKKGWSEFGQNMVAKGPDPAVTATFKLNDQTFTDVNALARPNRVPGPTVPGLRAPNADLQTAHAEIGAMMQAKNAGLKGGHGVLTVTGEPVCGAYCTGDVKTMGRALGLDSLTVIDSTGTRTFAGKELLPISQGGKGWKIE
jgi:hypothetical protein